MRSLRAAGPRATRLVVPDGERSKNLRQVARLYEALPRRRRGPRHASSSRSAAAWSATSRASSRRRLLRGAPVRAGADDAARDGRLQRRRQDRREPAARQEPGRRVPPAAPGLDRRGDARARCRGASCAAGLAEVVKHGAIRDAALFDALERELERVLGARARASLLDVLERALRDQGGRRRRRTSARPGVRMLLNFGHTLGHAIEALRGYRGVLHGEAVAIGHGLRGAALRGARARPRRAPRPGSRRCSTGRPADRAARPSRGGLISPRCASIRRSGTRASASWCCAGSAARRRCRSCRARSCRTSRRRGREVGGRVKLNDRAGDEPREALAARRKRLARLPGRPERARELGGARARGRAAPPRLGARRVHPRARRQRRPRERASRARARASSSGGELLARPRTEPDGAARAARRRSRTTSSTARSRTPRRSPTRCSTRTAGGGRAAAGRGGEPEGVDLATSASPFATRTMAELLEQGQGERARRSAARARARGRYRDARLDEALRDAAGGHALALAREPSEANPMSFESMLRRIVDVSRGGVGAALMGTRRHPDRGGRRLGDAATRSALGVEFGRILDEARKGAATANGGELEEACLAMARYRCSPRRRRRDVPRARARAGRQPRQGPLPDAPPRPRPARAALSGHRRECRASGRSPAPRPAMNPPCQLRSAPRTPPRCALRLRPQRPAWKGRDSEQGRSWGDDGDEFGEMVGRPR